MNSRHLAKVLYRPLGQRRTRWLVCPNQQSYATSSKPYYVTTPIFYVNADPHVGHLYSMVMADILKRWQILKGRDAILCTGTDEHGMKIQQAAAIANTPPKEFCDGGAEIFKSLAKRANISNDHFIRTTDEDHKETVRYVWLLLMERGYIYTSKHEGWYSVSDETFYPETVIEKRLDPSTGRTFMASQETGKEVQWSSESNYHFRLSHFRDQLLDFYKSNPEFVVPATRMADVVNLVTDGLENLSISRPVDRLTWGIRVPGDDTQTMYVWLDALVNYITKAGYPWAPENKHSGGWPADVQIVGKDIIRFHCIYWPAFLFALGLEPPKQVLSHAHWTLNHKKMAKSTGNVINPFYAIDRFGVDVMRYYLAHDGGIANDSDYANEFIVERYKKGLQNGVGNLISRVIRPQFLWSVEGSVKSAANGTLREPDSSTAAQIELLENLQNKVNNAMVELNPSTALQTVMNVVYETNKYLQLNSPWVLAKTRDPIDQKRVERTIFHCVEAIRIVGIFLQPFMPEKATQLLDMISVDPSKRGYDYARYKSDDSYGTPMMNPNRDSYSSLFPPLPVET